MSINKEQLKLLIEKLEKLSGKKVILTELNVSKTDRHIAYQNSDMNKWKLGDILNNDSDSPVDYHGIVINHGIAYVQDQGVIISKMKGGRQDTLFLSFEELTAIMRNLLD